MQLEPRDNPELAVSDDIVLVSVTQRRTLLAILAQTGNVLWRKIAACGDARLVGPNDGRLLLLGERGCSSLLDVKTGNEVARLFPTGMDAAVMSGGSIFAAGERISRFDGGRAKWTARQHDFPPSAMYATRRAIIVSGADRHSGGDLLALDRATGRLRWSRAAARADVIVCSDEVYLLGEERIERLAAADGRVRADLRMGPLSDDFQPSCKGAGIVFASARSRGERALVLWEPGQAPRIWRDPVPASPGGLMLDTTWITARGDSVRAFDLGHLDVPDASLPPAARVARSLEMSLDVEQAESLLRGIPDAARELLRIAEDVDSADRRAAIVALRSVRHGHAVPRLLALLQRPTDEGVHDAVLFTLDTYDDPRVAEALLLLAARTDRHWLRREAQRVANQQLWRTGRIPSLGLCPGPLGPLLRPGKGHHTIGSASPTTHARAAPDGRWVLIEQVRADTNGDGRIAVASGYHDWEGDERALFLVLGGGPGVGIDELVSVDLAGRFLVVRRGPCLTLLDTLENREVDLTALGADGRDDDPRIRCVRRREEVEALSGHRGISFDRAGKQLAYIRINRGKRRIVVRNLITGREVTIDPGSAPLTWARLSDSGRWVEMRISQPGGPLTTQIVPSAGGPSRTVDGYLAAFGNGLLYREATGEIRLLGTGRSSSLFAPATCSPKLEHVDEGRQLAVVSCATEGPERTYMLHGPGGRMTLGMAVAPSFRVSADGRWLLLGDALVDLDRRRMLHAHADVAFGRYGAWRSSDQLRIVDLENDRELFRLRLDQDATLFEVGGVLSAPPHLVDLAQGRILGRLKGLPFAVTSSGRVLVPSEPPDERGRPAQGPLRWVSPQPGGVAVEQH